MSATLGTPFPNGPQTLPEPRDSGIWFDSDAIIDRRPNPLLAAEVSLGCLNRDMSQQELDLFQFASRNMAQTSARPTQIVRSQFRHTDPFRTILHNVPDRLFCHAVAAQRPGGRNLEEKWH